MGTNVRPNIAPSNKYWISKHRYYELKHFCLQYPEWQSALEAMKTDSFSSYYIRVHKDDTSHKDPTADLATLRANLQMKINAVEHVAWETDPVIGPYILEAVTTGASYTYLSMNKDLKCSRDEYYENYRKFFWLLNTYKS